MEQEPSVEEIERRAWEERVSIRRLCSLAGISQSTFARWKKSERNPNPTVPNLRTLRKLESALDRIAAENRIRAGRTKKAVAA